MTRFVIWLGAAALAGFCLVEISDQPQAAPENAVYVDIRDSETPDAKVTRWKLYGASHALAIGIDNYINGWPRLSNGVKDAQLVAAELERRGFEVQLLTDVSSDQMRDALRRFFAVKGRDPEARLFVWFAGHGHTEFGEGYIVPADAPAPGSADFLLNALHMGDIGTMVRQARAKHVFAVFDSCFAGTIFSRQRARPPAAITRAVVKPVRQFLTSGDADQKVSDDGTFRKLFLSALSGGEPADMNGDGFLTGTELSFYLEDRMINLTQAAQTPRGGKLRDPRFDLGDFVFVLPKGLPGSSQLAQGGTSSESRRGVDESVFELEFWSAIKDSDDPVQFQAYLQAFPHGRFAPLAKVLAGQAPKSPGRDQDEPKALTKADELVSTAPAVRQLEPGSNADELAMESTGSIDGRWAGQAVWNSGSGCKPPYEMRIEISGDELSGEIYNARDESTAISGKTKSHGEPFMMISSLRGGTRFRVSPSGHKLVGTWEMAQLTHAHQPCQGTFVLTRALP